MADRIKRLEEAGVELRECASQLGWTSSDDSRWIKRAESAVKAWDKEAKL
jgi:DNA-binding transcriptional MerR regulator